MHGDVIKWKHFPRYWPFVLGIHRSPVNSPHKDQWRGALMLSLICVWINGWVNNREAGDLRRYRTHYDVTVMLLVIVAAIAGITQIRRSVFLDFEGFWYYYEYQTMLIFENHFQIKGHNLLCLEGSVPSWKLDLERSCTFYYFSTKKSPEIYAYWITATSSDHNGVSN